MPLPIVVKYNIKLLAEEAKQRAYLHRSAITQEDFGFDGRRFLAVPLKNYADRLPFVLTALKEVDAIAGLASEHKRLATFNKKFTDHFVDRNTFTSFLIHWKRQKEVVSLQKSETDLLDAFFRRGLLADPPPGIKKLYLTKLIVVDLDRNLKEIAYTLQGELDLQERVSDLIYAVAPRATLAALSLFPTTALPKMLGYAVESLIGLLQFFEVMVDAKADDYMSEEEVAEAWWALAGILPFKLIQKIMFRTEILEIGVALFTMLVEALSRLPDLLNRWSVALDEGWGCFGDFDRSSEIFIPAYAINDLFNVTE